MRFEYLVKDTNVVCLGYRNAQNAQDELNKLGLLGWELSAITNGKAIFKRPIKEIPESTKKIFGGETPQSYLSPDDQARQDARFAGPAI